jgi:hypothetical protein
MHWDKGHSQRIDVKHHIGSQMSLQLLQLQPIHDTITIRQGISHKIPAIVIHEMSRQMEEDFNEIV